MSTALKHLVKETLKQFDIGITSYTNLQWLIGMSSSTGSDIGLLLELKLPDQDSSGLLRILRNSRSQLRQDLFVLSELGFKRSGFFVEFGATNGIDLSNTYLLEKEFGWGGILAEPAKRWLKDLRDNRNSLIETDCVWRDSNSILTFNEVDSGEYSTIASYGSSDIYRRIRKRGKTYNVKTISLEDLLDKHHAPAKIDYLSIDTEGSEYEILSNFNFDKYQIKIITCEHNFTPAREKIFSLLTQNGYVRKFEKFSRFDDWYVRTD
jgi:FkbM family methyltransferase